MVELDAIDDPDLLRKHAKLAMLERELFRKEAQKLARELAAFKAEKSPEQLELVLVRLTEQLAKLRHKVFGDSSERRPSPHPPAAPKAKKPKTGHGPTPQLRLPTREVHHRLEGEHLRCPVCEGTLEEMGEVTEDADEVTVERRRFVVLKHKRHKYRCRCNSVVKTAPAPLRLILGGRCA